MITARNLQNEYRTTRELELARQNILHYLRRQKTPSTLSQIARDVFGVKLGPAGRNAGLYDNENRYWVRRRCQELNALKKVGYFSGKGVDTRVWMPGYQDKVHVNELVEREIVRVKRFDFLEERPVTVKMK